MIKFIPLEKGELIDTLISQSSSAVKAVAVFKHSTRCSISKMALSRLQRDWNKDAEIIPVYYLDLLNYPILSTSIAQVLQVRHESPQLLLIKNGKCIGNFTHNAITMDAVEEALLLAEINN